MGEFIIINFYIHCYKTNYLNNQAKILHIYPNFSATLLVLSNHFPTLFILFLGHQLWLLVVQCWHALQAFTCLDWILHVVVLLFLDHAWMEKHLGRVLLVLPVQAYWIFASSDCKVWDDHDLVCLCVWVEWLSSDPWTRYHLIIVHLKPHQHSQIQHSKN